MARERVAAPILGDVAEQAVLDLVPLRGAGRIVADRDRQPGLVGKLLQLELPPFLNRPISSFFLVSTEITGWPAAWKAHAWALMCANWPSRSTWLAPSR